jgi:hypothetical protein
MRIASLPFRAPTVALVVSSCATLAAVTAWLLVAPATRDSCALPGNSASLSPSAQDLLAKHAVACSDLINDRITHDQYLQLIGLTSPPVVTPPMPETEWASTVRAVSSQYTDTSWSAQQVLGPPDVFPSAGDNAKAWASLAADGGDEFIEVGFAQAYPISELAIYETFNPGAVRDIELITASGKQIHRATPPDVLIDGKPMPSRRLAVPVDCGEPIVAARITLASGQVAGWNEIDAIGATTCTPGAALTLTE